MGTTSPGATISPAKLATIVPLSGEIVRNSNAEAMVRQLLAENVSAGSLDAALFNANAAVPGTSPAGSPQWHRASGRIRSRHTPGADGGRHRSHRRGHRAGCRLQQKSSSIVCRHLPRPWACRMPRAEESFLWPILMSAALPAGTVIGIAAGGLATVVDAPRIEAGTEVTLHMDDAPNELVSVAARWLLRSALRFRPTPSRCASSCRRRGPAGAAAPWRGSRARAGN